jgi:hypothetical protein
LDTDDDNVGDNKDDFPNDPAASLDRDDDGYPDKWNPGMSEDDSTTELKLDHYPDDPMKWKKEGFFDSTPIPLILLFILVPPILILILIGILVYLFKGPKNGETVPIVGDEGDKNIQDEE